MDMPKSTQPQRWGSRTTALQALGDRRLRATSVIVTGASSGLGVETARVLALAGADVVMACRNVAAGERVATELRAALPSNAGTLVVRPLDLADLASVRDFAITHLAGGGKLDLLINNAGIMATPLGATAQGHELQLGTNHLGHFLLTTLVLPALEASPAARIVNVASSLHSRGRGERMLATLVDDPGYKTRKYVPFDSYGDSKLANVLFTRGLSKRLPANVTTYALHPGVIPTELSRSMGAMGSIFRTLIRPFGKSIAQGAATTIYAATAPDLAGHSGAYLADCRIAKPSADARDDALAQALWTHSERVTAS